MKDSGHTLHSLPGGQNHVSHSKAHAQAIIRGEILPDEYTDVAKVQESFTNIKNGIIDRSQNILRQSTTIADTRYLMASGDETVSPMNHAGVIYSSGGFMPPPVAIPSQSTGATEAGSGKFIDWEI